MLILGFYHTSDVHRLGLRTLTSGKAVLEGVDVVPDALEQNRVDRDPGQLVPVEGCLERATLRRED